MDGELIRFGLTSFVTLLVVVDPFGIVPIFAALTVGTEAPRRRAIMTRAVFVAFSIALFFLIVGPGALAYLGVTVHAFSISGGILLFGTALPMLFGQRPGLQSPERGERTGHGEDIATFPLAIPLLAGPGLMTTILLLMANAKGSPLRVMTLVLAVAVVFLVSWLVLRLGERLVAHVGEEGVHVVTRIMGIILAALAVQYVLNGVTGYYLEVR